MLGPERMEEILRELQAAKEALESDVGGLREEMRDCFRDVSSRVEVLSTTASDILLEIGGVPDRRYREPDRKTIRSRLHVIEDRQSLQGAIAEQMMREMKAEQQDRAALKDVVNDLKTEHDRAKILNDNAAKRWSTRRVMLVTACAVVGAVGALAATAVSIIALANAL